MKTVTPRERIEAAYRGEYIDRVPVNTNCSNTGYIAEKLGWSRVEILTDPEKELEAMKLSQKEFPSDVLRVPGDPLLPEAAAARRGLKTGKDAVAPRRLLEDKTALEGMQARDPRESKTYKPYLDMIPRVMDLFPDHPFAILAPGVWSNAAELRGPETFLYDTVDDPDFVHGVMRFATDLAKMRGEAMAEKGVDIIVFGDPSAGCSLISPGIYREFVKPYHREIFEHLKKGFDVRVGLHICGYTDPIMEDIVSTGVDGISLDQTSSLEKMFEASGGKLVVIGNIPPPLFASGTRDEIDAAVKTCLETAVGQKGYILASGCGIPPQTPLENLEYFMEAAEKYGQYD